eukprot:CAMPEP_0195289024 /NCGR_PEP_ID=MMETSP0707-20130614/5473_1 /TAXON_ID=33640 /ORGANISM="Asterionellopsis glacialis, Strain CCMP134" /LENGTH=293 /DNA_ID=CAMNT_0040348977 /DNA_START=60 /DNA_END=941 /DNA_ORIENTATION=+
MTKSLTISHYPYPVVVGGALVAVATFSAIADAFAVIHHPSAKLLSSSQRQLIPQNTFSQVSPTPLSLHHRPHRHLPYLALQQSNNNNHDNGNNNQEQPQDPLALIAANLNTESLSNGLASALTPWEDLINDSTDGWGLTYADLSPETESTPLGVGFLATNIAYALTGLLLTVQGDVFYGCVTELAGVVSFWYHYSQLKHGQLNSQPVKLALMVDYMTAGAALMCTGFYLLTFPQGFGQIPVEALIAGFGGLTSLGLCWVWEMGYPYLILHSLWHLLSAYAGYTVGQAHIAAFT